MEKIMKSPSNLRLVLTITFLMFLIAVSNKSFACDANAELPGALPPAPHGGELGEAVKTPSVELVSQSQQEGLEKLYWEAVYAKTEKQILLSILSGDVSKRAVFTVLPTKKEISSLQIKVERVREGKFLTVPFSILDDHVVVNYDATGLNRFIVHVEATHADGALRKARVQIDEE